MFKKILGIEITSTGLTVSISINSSVRRKIQFQNIERELNDAVLESIFMFDSIPEQVKALIAYKILTTHEEYDKLDRVLDIFEEGGLDAAIEHLHKTSNAQLSYLFMDILRKKGIINTEITQKILGESDDQRLLLLTADLLYNFAISLLASNNNNQVAEGEKLLESAFEIALKSQDKELINQIFTLLSNPRDAMTSVTIENLDIKTDAKSLIMFAKLIKEEKEKNENLSTLVNEQKNKIASLKDRNAYLRSIVSKPFLGRQPTPTKSTDNDSKPIIKRSYSF